MRYLFILLLITGCSLKRPVGDVYQPKTVNPEQLQFDDLDINQDGNISEREFKIKNAKFNC